MGYVCVCVCVAVSSKAREKPREGPEQPERLRTTCEHIFYHCTTAGLPSSGQRTSGDQFLLHAEKGTGNLLLFTQRTNILVIQI